MSERVSSVFPSAETVKLGEKEYRLSIPTLNVLADIEEHFDVSFMQIQELLDVNKPGMFKNFRYIIWRLLLEDNPELQDGEITVVGKELKLDQLGEIGQKLTTIFTKGMPQAGEATPIVSSFTAIQAPEN